MSVREMAKVWEYSKAEGNGLLVMLALADHADDDGVCYPGIARIAKKTKLSERTVQRFLVYLEEKLGEVEKRIGEGIKVSGERGEGFTNKYILRVKRGDNLTPQSSIGVSTVTERGDKAVSPKPSVEPSDNLFGKRAQNHLSEALTREELAGLVFPASLNTPEFISAAERFRAYKSTGKFGKPLSRRTLKTFVKNSLTLGVVRAVENIDYHIGLEHHWMYYPGEERRKTVGSNETKGTKANEKNQGPHPGGNAGRITNRNAGTANAGDTSNYGGVGKPTGDESLPDFI